MNIDENEIDKVYKADCRIVSDAKLAVAALMRELSASVGQVPPAKIEKEPHLDPMLRIGGPNHINPGQLAQSLSKMLPDNAIVLADAGAHLAWLGYYLELTRGQNYHKPGSFGPMAWATNGALGTKMAHPDRTVIVGCGDGCYNLSGFELMTAVQYDIPVIWIIFDDGEFKLIKIFQLSAFHEIRPGRVHQSGFRRLREGLRGAADTASRPCRTSSARSAKRSRSNKPNNHRRGHHALCDSALQPVSERPDGRNHGNDRQAFQLAVALTRAGAIGRNHFVYFAFFSGSG